MQLTRRSWLAAAAAAVFTPFPAFAAAAESVLRVIPHADLKNLDPIWTTAYITRNHGYLVYDTLFATDANLKVQPQMVESWTVSPDKLTWTFRLRDGLLFHDNTPVKAEDAVASLVRWGKRDGMGQKLFEEVASLTAQDDKTFTLKLKRPYGLVLESLGKISSNVPFVMPRRLAETDPFQQVPEVIGSGPFIFKKDEWVPGAKVVYVKNPAYKPRPEPPSGAAGGKVAKVDRVEWIYIPDPTTAMNALISGEVDYWEQVPPDLAGLVSQAPGVKVETLDPIGSLGMLRFNSLLPPFDKPEIRRAVLRGFNQEDFVRAAIGSPEYFKLCDSVYPCGSPNASDAGVEMIRPASIEAAKKMLQDAGYKGEKIVLLHPTDISTLNAFSTVAAEKLKAIGFNVDDQAMDWSTVTSRRAKKDPLAEGGWSLFPTWWIGADVLNPITSIALGGNGDKGWFGWLKDDRLEQMRTEYALATDPAEQKKIAEDIQRRAIELGAFANLGTFFVPIGYRDNVSGMIKSPVQFFWNMEVKR